MMIWALLGISIAGFGFAATAVALGIRVGSLRADVMNLRIQRNSALGRAEMGDDRIHDLESVLEVRASELQSLYEELETCGNADQRSRVAVAGIRLMLPAQASQEADTDPG